MAVSRIGEDYGRHFGIKDEEDVLIGADFFSESVTAPAIGAAASLTYGPLVEENLTLTTADGLTTYTLGADYLEDPAGGFENVNIPAGTALTASYFYDADAREAVEATGVTGGGGAVDSVDGMTGAVDLTGKYPEGDTANPTDGYVWTYDAAASGWLPKAAAGGSSSPKVYRGATAPPTPHSYLIWIDESSNPARLRYWDGSTWTGHGHGNATASAAGFLSAALFSKLDALGQVCQVQRTTDLAVFERNWTPVTWNSEVKDVQNWHGTTNTERITLPAGGFLITASMTWNAEATSQRFIRIQHYSSAGTNIATYSSPNVPTTTGDQYGRGAVPMAYIDTAANDYVVAEAWQNSGATLNFGTGGSTTLPTPTFTVVRLK